MVSSKPAKAGREGPSPVQNGPGCHPNDERGKGPVHGKMHRSATQVTSEACGSFFSIPCNLWLLAFLRPLGHLWVRHVFCVSVSVLAFIFTCPPSPLSTLDATDVP